MGMSKLKEKKMLYKITFEENTKLERLEIAYRFLSIYVFKSQHEVSLSSNLKIPWEENEKKADYYLYFGTTKDINDDFVEFINTYKFKEINYIDPDSFPFLIGNTRLRVGSLDN